MARFATAREAKEFPVGRLVEQARLDGVELTDVERKMLYFSESGWTLPDIAAVNEVFDRDYEHATYESKIAALVRAIRTTRPDGGGEELSTWDEALRTLRGEDHYLLVMVDQAGPAGRKRGRFAELAMLTLIGCCAVVVALFLMEHC